MTFHNGDSLTAADVVATLGRVLDPAIGGAFGTQGVYISYLGSAEISALDKRTVQIVTEGPMAEQGALAHEWDSGLAIIFLANAQDGPAQDRRVRQALNYALDVDEIIAEIKDGAAKPLNGYLTPHHFGYNPGTPVYPYDPDKARSLLAEAGYSDGLNLVFDIRMRCPMKRPSWHG